MMVLIPSIFTVHRRYPLTAPLLWAFSIWGLLHMAGGLLPIPQGWFRDGSHAVVYSWWLVPGYLKYDQLTHAYGFGITSWLCWHILKCALRSPDGSPVRPTPGILVLCVAAGMGFGAFNESSNSPLRVSCLTRMSATTPTPAGTWWQTSSDR